jgi:hypothetical protein
LTPAVFAFLLSFTVIFITWVNHHAALRLVHKSSVSFIYANGFLLHGVVFIPFPTSLLGAFLLTDHAAPAVVLYNAVLVQQAIAWILLSRAALTDRLASGEGGMRPVERDVVRGGLPERKKRASRGARLIVRRRRTQCGSKWCECAKRWIGAVR